MSDIQCPYCESWQEICHDDGYGYDEDERYEQECSNCSRTFRFQTAIQLIYTAYCNGDHEWESWAPKHPNIEGCTRCEETRHVKND